MKVVKQVAPPVKPSFEPIVLTITLETAEEARAMYAIFNNARNTALLSKGGFPVKEALGETHYVGGSKDVIAQGVTYEEFYGGL